MKPNSTSSLLAAIVTSLWLFLGQAAVMGVSLDLQGQSKGSTSWISGNLQDWQELDYIPCRVYVTGGPVNAQSVTISFPHLSGTTPGVQDLFNFGFSKCPDRFRPNLGHEWFRHLVLYVPDQG